MDKTSTFELIYKEVMKIPVGRVATYGQIAALAGNPKWSRVVGYALHKNPAFGTIPCHRVVNRKGRLAPAFAVGGAKIQAQMLQKEGVTVVDGYVDLEKYGYKP